MTHTVVTAPKAAADIRQNARWLKTTRSARSADRWSDGIVSAIAALSDRPQQYPEADEAVELGLPLRFKLYGRRPQVYRLLFTIDGDTVNVLRVMHAAQDSLTEDDL